MSVKETVLETMKTTGKPLSAGEVEELSGLTRKDVDKAFKELKEENVDGALLGLIVLMRVYVKNGTAGQVHCPN